MTSKVWNKYYERYPFFEGWKSAFDPYGENTSFNFDALNASLHPLVRTKIRISKAFSKVGQHLKKTMDQYAQT